jgi:ubiquitin carboxyl-terminal hydrolase 35/38
MSNGGGGQNQEAAAAANQQTAQTAISANCVDPTKKLEPQSKVSLLLPTGIRPRPQQPPQQQQQPQQSPNSNSPFVSLVQKVFGGKLQTTYECCNCKSISLHKECFTDLHLAFPDKEAAVETRTSERQAAKKAEAEVVVAENGSEKAEPLTMQKMVTSCLKSEVLQGDNQYHCDHCGNLQDAVKTMKIIEGPEYLMTTLMRFQYDRVQNRKTKVFTDIKYELNLTLPTYGHLGKDFVVADEDDEDGDTTIVEDDVNEVIVDEIDAKNVQYSLYAIVVHSGYSSDGGHYYTYAREPMAYNDTDVEAHNKNSTWYIFNDSKVSFSTFDSFVNISKKLPRDTAYLLFYQKVKQPQEPPQPQIVSLSSEMRTELKKSVEHDNASFSREKERSSTSVYNDYSSNSQSSSMSYRKGDKDDDGLGGGGRGNCGGGDFNTPGRFVC